MADLIIENQRLRVAVAPHYGARVVQLVDKASGRDWMTAGGESANTGEDAVYSSAEAVAWDECFPTVSAYDATATPWRRQLRDHGDLWGRPWSVEMADGDQIALSYSDPQFRFSRTLSLDGASLVAQYALESRADEPLPYLWALHGLLAVKPGDRIAIPGAGMVKTSYLSLAGTALGTPDMPWSGASDVLPFALEDVQPRDTNFAAKFNVDGLPGGSASIGQPGQRLTIAWDQTISALGIWLTYGAWPQPGGHYEIALEPSSTMADHLGQAIANGGKPLAPGERRDWRVTLTVSE